MGEVWCAFLSFRDKAVPLSAGFGRNFSLHPDRFRDYITLRCPESLSSLILKVAFSVVDRALFPSRMGHCGLDHEDQGAPLYNNSLTRLLGGSG
jgi:hypothetical protein